MPNLATWLVGVLKNAVWAMQHGSSLGRWSMTWTYLRIEMKRAVLGWGLKRKITSETVWGQTLNFPEYELFAVLFEEIYLPGIYSFRSPNTHPHIIDCGANIGLAIAYLLTHHPEATITAFEPDDETFKVLASNHARNGWKNVKLHQAAVHRGEERLTFFSHSPKGSVASSFRKSVEGGGSAFSLSEATRIIEIPTVRLSSYIDHPVDLLKMDVEGSEMAVLEDLVESGKLQFIDQIIMEYHHHVEPDEDLLGHFLGLLEQNGFGYDFRAPVALPFARGEPHNFMLYAYRKTRRAR